MKFQSFFSDIWITQNQNNKGMMEKEQIEKLISEEAT